MAQPCHLIFQPFRLLKEVGDREEVAVVVVARHSGSACSAWRECICKSRSFDLFTLQYCGCWSFGAVRMARGDVYKYPRMPKSRVKPRDAVLEARHTAPMIGHPRYTFMGPNLQLIVPSQEVLWLSGEVTSALRPSTQFVSFHSALLFARTYTTQLAVSHCGIRCRSLILETSASGQLTHTASANPKDASEEEGEGLRGRNTNTRSR